MRARSAVLRCAGRSGTAVANSRSQIVLKYIMSKCAVLTRYRLIPRGLPGAAAKIGSAEESDIPKRTVQLRRQIEQCAPCFREPFEAALIRRPRVAK